MAAVIKNLLMSVAALSRSALLLGLNSVRPSFWQRFPVGIEVLQLKIPRSA